MGGVCIGEVGGGLGLGLLIAYPTGHQASDHYQRTIVTESGHSKAYSRGKDLYGIQMM